MSRHPVLLNFGKLDILHYIVQLQITGSVIIDMLYGIPSHLPFSFVKLFMYSAFIPPCILFVQFNV